ncbi:MAG TPA: rhodanese-like domain-containing protein [Chitinophagaceae bacterium]|jgi:phage shock protein E|nr:rhodanese-like domain-containing protein [Chitinophagaceae bacterium]
MSTFFSKLFNREQTDFAALVKQGAIIIDVRTTGEYRGGHIKGSRNIPLDSIKSKLAEIKKLQKPVITVCRSGARSGMAKSILLANGLVAYNGGAWDHLERKL